MHAGATAPQKSKQNGQEMKYDREEINQGRKKSKQDRQKKENTTTPKLLNIMTK